MPLLNTDVCFMSLSRIFHLYPVDNEVEVGESRSSQRKPHLTFRKQKKRVPSEARAHSGERPHVKVSARTH